MRLRAHLASPACLVGLSLACSGSFAEPSPPPAQALVAATLEHARAQYVEAAEPYTVVFRMKRPQPALLMMLASGYSPIYAAHVSPAQYRTGCVGTGPFRLKEWRRGEFVEYVKNPDYFVKGRPYLDGLKYVVIVERGTRTAALQAAPSPRNHRRERSRFSIAALLPVHLRES